MKTYLALLIALLLPKAVYAQTTGTQLLSGTVAAVRSLQIAPETEAAALDLAPGYVSDLKVATITERISRSGSYTVTVESENGGTLNGSLSNDLLSYSLTYNGASVGELSPETPVIITDKTAGNAAPEAAKVLRISYASRAGLSEDTYSDTLTFAILAK